MIIKVSLFSQRERHVLVLPMLHGRPLHVAGCPWGSAWTLTAAPAEVFLTPNYGISSGIEGATAMRGQHLGTLSRPHSDFPSRVVGRL